jgi:hypothetical protein
VNKKVGKSTSETLAELFGAAEKRPRGRPRRGPAPTKAPPRTGDRKWWRAQGDRRQRDKRRAHSGIDSLGQRGKPVLDRGGWRVLWSRMAPGRWYGLAELRVLMPEYEYGAENTFARRMVARGVAERGLNPYWTGRTFDGPRYLYRRLERPDIVGRWRGRRWAAEALKEKSR